MAGLRITIDPGDRIAFQGEPGAYSHLACTREFPGAEVLPCATFEDALTAVAEGRAAFGMIPIENSLAGRVADIHHLLPGSGLFIVGECFLRVRHQLMGLKTARLEHLKTVVSHTHALGQCRRAIRELSLRAEVVADTAGAARMVAERGDASLAAIASELAAEIYGLKVFRSDLEDAPHNTTRFVVLAREAREAAEDGGPVVTSFVFRVRNVPAALYKALGGFATNGVNMTKLESYQVGGSFVATQFFADIEGHPKSRPVALAMEELAFFTSELRILGVYRADPFRFQAVPGGR
ncbi:MAG: prephenate dehydratase [Alphaproteobacteria bacterium]